MDNTIIELVNLTKRYGSFTAVDSLNLNIKKGEVFGLLGPNGAGKSTTILMMLGLTDPDDGSIKVCGLNPTSNPIEVKKRVGYLPEDVGFYDDRTGLENLVYTARLNSLSTKDAKEKAIQLLNRIGLAEHMNKKTGNYSRGMRQRLGLADVLIKNPEIIVLDEPTLGIDPTGVRSFLEMIVNLSKEEGLTVLFSSHHLHQVQQVCDRVGLFVGGKLLAEGDVQSLARKLFSNSLYTIEVDISDDSNKETGKTRSDILKNKLSTLLTGIDGVLEVNSVNNKFHIDCSKNRASDIAKAIVNSGLNLNYLNKREYGLDDIYHRYFEGGLNHE